MKQLRTSLLVAAGLAAVALPAAASARPHQQHYGGYGTVGVAYRYSPYSYGYSPYGYGSAAYGYSPYGYGYSPYSYGSSPYGYSPYGYGLSRHQRHHIRDLILDQRDHVYGFHNQH